MEWTEFTTHDDGPLIAGRRAGSGPPVLLLHGGPGLGFDYLRDLADELAEENDVAWYQQRGQEPSAADGPYTVAADVGDARRVLDALGWEKAYVVGHSWGGHLALHVAEAMPERLLGVLAVDPLGSVGDGRWPEFDEEMFRRTPEDVRERAREIDELSMAGKADDELALEGMRLVWPAYFADPETRTADARATNGERALGRDGAVDPGRAAGARGGAAGDSASPSASCTARGARCRSPPRRTRPSGFRAPGSRWSRAPGISCGSRRPALFAHRFDASPPTSGLREGNRAVCLVRPRPRRASRSHGLGTSQGLTANGVRHRF